MAVSGLRLCARALPSRGKRGPPLIAARGPLTIAAPPAAEQRLQTRRPSSRGPRVQPLRGMWDPPRPGLEPVSPALAGRFSTTAPPGKPHLSVLTIISSWPILFPHYPHPLPTNPRSCRFSSMFFYNSDSFAF